MKRLAPLVLAAFLSVRAHADTPAIAAEFAGSYTLGDLGAPPGVPTALAGIAFDPADANRLLIGGQQGEVPAAIYALRVVRGSDQRITGFAGPATLALPAHEAGGGMAFGPGFVFFVADVGQGFAFEYKPGSTAVDLEVHLANLGFGHGLLQIGAVPSWAAGRGQLKVTDNVGQWIQLQAQPDGNGTYTLSAGATVATQAMGQQSEGMAYVPPGSPGFANPTVLITERVTRAISANDVDANGDLVPPQSSRRVFVEGIQTARGMAIDPLTGDLLVTTYQAASTLKTVRGLAVPPTFHAIRGDEVYTSGANQYVELLDPLAEAYDGSSFDLVIYDGGGTLVGKVALDPAVLVAKAQHPLLVATSGAATAFGVTPDVALTVTLPASGQACFQNGQAVVHCIGWGTVTTAVGPESAGPAPTADQSLSCFDSGCFLSEPTPASANIAPPMPDAGPMPDAPIASPDARIASPDARPSSPDAPATSAPSASSSGCQVGGGQPGAFGLLLLGLVLWRYRRGTVRGTNGGPTGARHQSIT